MADTQILGEAQIPIRATLDKLPGDLNKAKSSVTDVLGSITGVAGGLVTGGFAVLKGAVLGVAKAAFGAGTTFDEAYDKIIIGTGATGTALDSLEKSFGNVFKNVPSDADTVEGALVELSKRLGLTGADLEGVTTDVVQLSRMLKTDATTTATDLSKVVAAWGIDNSDASKTLDELFKATQVTGIGMDTLMGAVIDNGAVMRTYGFSLEESIALFAGLDKAGLNSQVVVTGMRLAADKFAKAQAAVNTETVGGVDSMADSTTQLADLQAKLKLATIQQGEFTNKTKESTKVAKQQEIDKITAQISSLSAAMALGEKHTVTSTTANKTLKESLLETFQAIKDDTDATDALNLGCQIFGARAGPAITDAIRSGALSFEDLTAAITDSTGAVATASAASMSLPEKWQQAQNKITTALAPIGLAFLDAATPLIDKLQPALDKLGPFIADVVAPALDTLAGAIVKVANGDLTGALGDLFGGGDTTTMTAGLAGPVGIIGETIGGMLTDAIRGVFGLQSSVDDTANDLTKMLREAANKTGQALPSIAVALGRGFIQGIFGGSPKAAAVAEIEFPSKPQPFGQGLELSGRIILGNIFKGVGLNQLADTEVNNTIGILEKLYQGANDQAKNGFIEQIAKSINTANPWDIAGSLNKIQDPLLKGAVMQYLLDYSSKEILPNVVEAIQTGVTGELPPLFDGAGTASGTTFGESFNQGVQATARAAGVLAPLMGNGVDIGSQAWALGVAAAQSWQGAFSQQFNGWQPPSLNIDIHGNIIMPQAIQTPTSMAQNYINVGGVVINSPDPKTSGNAVLEMLKKLGYQQ